MYLQDSLRLPAYQVIFDEGLVVVPCHVNQSYFREIEVKFGVDVALD